MNLKKMRGAEVRVIELVENPLAPKKVITRIAFMSLFTDAELEAIYTASKQSIKIEIYLDKVKAAEDVTLTDPRTVAGVESMAAAGLIDAGRVSEILAGA